MFKLDDNFLSDLGLENMPQEQKKPFLQHIYQELELRVGTKLSDGMSDDQLTEFESIIDKKNNAVQVWLNKKVPDYTNDALFISLKNNSKLDVADPELLADYAATKWLEINRPDYRTVVESTLNEIKKEIIDNRAKILE